MCKDKRLEVPTDLADRIKEANEALESLLSLDEEEEEDDGDRLHDSTVP